MGDVQQQLASGLAGSPPVQGKGAPPHSPLSACGLCVHRLSCAASAPTPWASCALSGWARWRAGGHTALAGARRRLRLPPPQRPARRPQHLPARAPCPRRRRHMPRAALRHCRAHVTPRRLTSLLCATLRALCALSGWARCRRPSALARRDRTRRHQRQMKLPPPQRPPPACRPRHMPRPALRPCRARVTPRPPAARSSCCRMTTRDFRCWRTSSPRGCPGAPAYSASF